MLLSGAEAGMFFEEITAQRRFRLLTGLCEDHADVCGFGCDGTVLALDAMTVLDHDLVGWSEV